MDLISVILPIHNSERDLRKCVDSVLKQTYSNLEVILVDAGSADASYDICLAYVEKDSRVKVLHIENSGASAARKEGLRNATGTLIAFVDSDDWLESEAIEQLYTEMINVEVDIVAAGYIETYGVREKLIENNLEAGVYTAEHLEKYIFSQMLCSADFFELGIHPYLWNKLYKKEIIEPYVMSLNENVVVGEDVLCVFPAILEAGALSIISGGYYHYCIHPGSTMRNFRSEDEEVENIRTQYYELKKIFLNNKCKDSLLPQLERYILHHLMVRAMPYLDRALREMNKSMFEYMAPQSSVIIYGAGALGISLYRSWKKGDKYNIVGWCDRNYEERKKLGYPVMTIEEALKRKYDNIVIAVLKKTTAEQIEEALRSNGVDKKKIIWLNLSDLKEDKLVEQIIGEDTCHFCNV